MSGANLWQPPRGVDAAIRRGDEVLKQWSTPPKACFQCGKRHTGKFAAAARAACARGSEVKACAASSRYQRQTADTPQSELSWYQAQAAQANAAKRG